MYTLESAEAERNRGNRLTFASVHTGLQEADAGAGGAAEGEGRADAHGAEAQIWCAAD